MGRVAGTQDAAEYVSLPRSWCTACLILSPRKALPILSPAPFTPFPPFSVLASALAAFSLLAVGYSVGVPPCLLLLVSNPEPTDFDRGSRLAPTSPYTGMPSRLSCCTPRPAFCPLSCLSHKLQVGLTKAKRGGSENQRLACATSDPVFQQIFLCLIVSRLGRSGLPWALDFGLAAFFAAF